MADVGNSLLIEQCADRVRVEMAGGAPVLEQYVAPDARPFIHPIHVPGGAGVLTQDAPPHHPWQHGLYVGLNDVNGVGFWAEGLDPRRASTDGRFRSRLVGDAKAESGVARWTVATDYLDLAGEVMLDDRQDWSVTVTGDRLELDLSWELHARRDLTFGEYAYGGLFLRMPYRDEVGGRVFDSEGRSSDGCRARWVAVEIALPETDRVVLAAMLDHPGNPDAPVPWRIDNELGIGPSPSIAGAWTLAVGATKTFRYRLSVFGSSVESATVDEAWQRYAEELA